MEAARGVDTGSVYGTCKTCVSLFADPGSELVPAFRVLVAAGGALLGRVAVRRSLHAP